MRRESTRFASEVLSDRQRRMLLRALARKVTTKTYHVEMRRAVGGRYRVDERRAMHWLAIDQLARFIARHGIQDTDRYNLDRAVTLLEDTIYATRRKTKPRSEKPKLRLAS